MPNLPRTHPGHSFRCGQHWGRLAVWNLSYPSWLKTWESWNVWVSAVKGQWQLYRGGRIGLMSRFTCQIRIACLPWMLETQNLAKINPKMGKFAVFPFCTRCFSCTCQYIAGNVNIHDLVVHILGTRYAIWAMQWRHLIGGARLLRPLCTEPSLMDKWSTQSNQFSRHFERRWDSAWRCEHWGCSRFKGNTSNLNRSIMASFCDCLASGMYIFVYMNSSCGHNPLIAFSTVYKKGQWATALSSRELGSRSELSLLAWLRKYGALCDALQTRKSCWSELSLLALPPSNNIVSAVFIAACSPASGTTYSVSSPELAKKYVYGDRPMTKQQITVRRVCCLPG